MYSRLCRLILMVMFVAAACVAPAQQIAPTPNLVNSAIDEQQRTTLHGSMSPQLKAAVDLGSLPANRSLNRMILVLKPSEVQRKTLQSLIESQQMKGSANYHKWLTPSEFNTRFALSQADVAKVAAWLQSRGFTGVVPNASGQRIEFSGSVSAVETTFQTHMHQFEVKTASGTERHVANASEISIPAALSPVVAGVLSLNDFHSVPAHVDFGTMKRNADGKLIRVKNDTTFTDGNGNFQYALAPGDIRKIYGATSLPSNIDGTGVSVAVIGRSNVQLTDLQTFRSLFSLPPNDPNIILSGPDPGMQSYGDAGESTLDLEWVAAIAPRATVNFITAASTDTTDGVSLAAVYAVENVSAPILTLSYGQCEQHLGPAGNLFWNLVWEQAAAEGMSVFVSTGDGGAGQCDADDQNSGPAVDGDSVSGLASTPYNVAVGGTQFAENGQYMQYWDSNDASDYTSALGYIPEAAWNQSCDPTLPVQGENCAYGQTYYMSAGGGGGRSSCSQGTQDNNGNVTCTAGYNKPSWQTGTGVPTDGVRDLPDVALSASSANDPYLFCFLGGCQYTLSDSGQYLLQAANAAGGTSISTPIMASIMALVEQQNGTYQGLPNPVLYQLAAQQNASCNSTNRTDPSQAPGCVFNDVTAGDNGVPGLPGFGTSSADFTATGGYDLATGLGSVNVANLVSGWKNATASTTTTTALTLGSQTSKHGTPVDVNIAVASQAGTPTGDVVLLTDKYGAGDQYTLNTSGAWTGQVSDLPGGNYTLTARYGGDGTYANSLSAGEALTISPEDSVSTLGIEAVDPNTGNLVPVTTSQYYGYPLYFKGSVAGVSKQGAPTGSATVLMDGKTSIASASLTADGGIFLNSSDVPVGQHTLALQYAGDNSFNPGSSTPIQFTIPKGEAVTLIDSIGGPNNLLAAFVSYSGSAKATGTLQIFDNGTALSSALPIVFTGPVGDGYSQIVISHAPFTPGVHVLSAVYSGDSNYQSVTLGSDSAWQTTLNIGASSGITPTSTTFKMTSASTLPMGQIATFTFAVAPKTANTKVPTGTAFIFGNDNILTGGNLSNGQATAIFYADSAGTYKIVAQYQGDDTFAPSTSANSITLTVPKLTPATTFTTSAGYVEPNAQVTLNYTASGVKVNTYVEQDPNGTVTFTDSVNGGASTVLGTFPLNFINGVVGGYSGRFTLPTGTNLITAMYSGNGNFNAVSSTATVVTSTPDFVFTSGQASLTVPAGSSASSILTLTPELGYTGAISLACSGAPAGSSCSITPASLTLATEQSATLTISTPAPSPAPASASASLARLFGSVSLAGLVFLFLPRARRRSMFWMMLLIAVIPIGCGGSGSPKDTLLGIASSNTKTAAGSTVTLTATLGALTTNPTGTVTFYDGTTVIGSPVNVSQGSATLQTSTLAVGAHTITAVYSGDKHNVKSTSIAITQVITGNLTVTVTATGGGMLIHTISLPVSIQ